MVYTSTYLDRFQSCLEIFQESFEPCNVMQVGLYNRKPRLIL